MRPSIRRASPGEALQCATGSLIRWDLIAPGSALQLEEGYWGGLKPHWFAMGMLDEYQFHAGSQSVTLGRNSAECDYTLLYPDISRKQCKLEWNSREDIDTVTITSYSKIGIWINMTKLSHNEPVVLHHRDEISFTPPELRGNRAPGLTWYFWYNQRWTSAGRQAATQPRTGYRILETLGEGTYGKVYRAIENATSRVVALKAINKKPQLKARCRDEQGTLETSDPYKDVMKEFEMLRGIRHPNLIEYLGAPAIDIGTVLVMEIAEMDLDSWHFRFKNEHQRTTDEKEVSEIAQQICNGVRYLHTLGIIHRDVKPGNILTIARIGTPDHPDPVPIMKLADFGTAKSIIDASFELRTMVGTQHFCAPEVILRCEYGFSADSWGIAYTLLQLLLGQRTANWNEFQGDYPKPIQWDYIIGECLRNTSWSTPCKTSLYEMLRGCPRMRLCASEAYENKWIASFNASSSAPVVPPAEVVRSTCDFVDHDRDVKNRFCQIKSSTVSHARYSDGGLLFLGGSEDSSRPTYANSIETNPPLAITSKALRKKTLSVDSGKNSHSVKPQVATQAMRERLPTFHFPPVSPLSGICDGHHVFRRRDDDGPGMLMEYISPSQLDDVHSSCTPAVHCNLE